MQDSDLTMLRDQIHTTPEYQQLTASEQTASAPMHRRQSHAGTVGEALAPVLNWEKTDIEFWVQITQLIVLVLILRELQREA